MSNARMRYFIRVTNIAIFNALVEAAEKHAAEQNVTYEAQRRNGYYELSTGSADLWHDLYLYGQMIAQAQDEYIDGGELPA